MARRAIAVFLSTLTIVFLLLAAAPAAWSQQTQGNVTVIVLDPTGAVVSGAQLKLTDLATNDTRAATTQEAGNYTFVNLNFGQYKLIVTKDGFVTQTFDVVVQTARTTDIRATLKVGASETVVEVQGVAPLIETTTNATNITIDTKLIEDLPLGGRNIAQLANLSAGYNGTWNGLPSMAQGTTVDGIVGNTQRWRYQGVTSGANTAITPRLESIAEMTVSTDQIDMSQGWGNSAMHITYTTRRGTNNFHGRLYEDFRSSALNATSWAPNLSHLGYSAPVKSKYHQNEFGASIGGPVFKDKLFFFASFSVFDQPGEQTRTREYLTDTARNGTFTYGANCNRVTGLGCYTVNLYDVVTAYNTANPAANLPTVPNDISHDWLTQINDWRLSLGQESTSIPTDPNRGNWTWKAPGSVRYYYPTFRVDYSVSQNLRLNLAYNRSKANRPFNYPDHWPGDGRMAAQRDDATNASLGLDWTVSPTLINQLKFGYLYTATWYGMGGPLDFRNPGWTRIDYGYTSNSSINNFYEMPNSRMQPVFSLADNVTWAKGAHTINFGFQAYRDQNKYWDPEEGFPISSIGLSSTDPARNAITPQTLAALSSNSSVLPSNTERDRARQLYAILVGRISAYGGRHAYNTATGKFRSDATGDAVGSSTLNELLKSWGLYFQDSYRMKPNLAVNFGLRWDFVSPDKDLTNKYHALAPQDVFGPTEVWNVFNPGASSLKGTMDPTWVTSEAAYKTWSVTPQPAVGIAWTPRASGNFVEKLLGGEKTVVRVGYSLRRFTEPQQFVWDMGSSFAIGFYQSFWSNPTLTPTGAGTFLSGSKSLGDPMPQFAASPASFERVLHMNQLTLGSSFAAAGIDPKIRQPYTQSWNFGIQRDLGSNRVLEVRYNGNRSIRQWLVRNMNEVNIVENGFLDEFKHAQANYAANNAAGVQSFANRGLAGQYDLPIMSAAQVPFTDSELLGWVKNGQVGTFANRLATNRDYFCRLVGNSFSPCASTNPPATVNGQPVPINFWLANPFALGSWMGAGYMTDAGYSNYNGLQVELRQRQWHGVNATANYTWSKTLGVTPAPGDYTGTGTQFTLRDLRRSYAPATTDRNHVIHISATYDLPVGQGKQFLNYGGIIERILGGWTVSTIFTFQTGTPFRITGPNNTFNNLRDGGVVLNGITAKELQDRVGLYFNESNGQPYFFDPNWMTVSQGPTGTYQATFDGGSITPFATPGEWGPMIWLHGPQQTYTDIGISKSAKITERFKFKFQTEMLNALNHPTFAQSSTGLGDGFGRGSQQASSRRIEFRANLEF